VHCRQPVQESPRLAADEKIQSWLGSEDRSPTVSSLILFASVAQRWISSAMTSSELPIAAEADNAHLSRECSE
jgi:hypothetical protein